MNIYQLLVIIAIVASCYAQDKRLIALSESHQEWMSEYEILNLAAARIHFMDVTDYVNVSISAAPTPSPLPNQPLQKEYLSVLLPLLNGKILEGFITSLASYHTRYYRSDTGAAAARWIQSQFQNMAQQAGRSDVTVELFTHSFVQPSVIATIPGKGPKKNEVVVIGAHEDSIVSPTSGRSPGADDDASGTATVLETFRVLIANGYVPDRTVKFMTYAGEEGGLLGSQAIATSFANQNINVYGVLQLDMTGYGGTAPIAFLTDFTDVALTNFMKLLVDVYCVLTWTNTKCGYGCSDHASWHQVGYRAAMPAETLFSNSNPYIHTASDTLDKLSVSRMHEYSKLALAFIVELAGRTLEI